MRDGRNSDISSQIRLRGKFRQVGYGFYPGCFFGEVAKIAIDHEARIDKAQGKMLRLCISDLGSPQPKYVDVWGSILSDIFLSPKMDSKLIGMIDMCVNRGEFASVTVDSTVKPTRPLVGQLGHNRRKQERRERTQYHMLNNYTLFTSSEVRRGRFSWRGRCFRKNPS